MRVWVYYEHSVWLQDTLSDAEWMLKLLGSFT